MTAGLSEKGMKIAKVTDVRKILIISILAMILAGFPQMAMGVSSTLPYPLDDGVRSHVEAYDAYTQYAGTYATIWAVYPINPIQNRSDIKVTAVVSMNGNLDSFTEIGHMWRYGDASPISFVAYEDVWYYSGPQFRDYIANNSSPTYWTEYSPGVGYWKYWRNGIYQGGYYNYSMSLGMAVTVAECSGGYYGNYADFWSLEGLRTSDWLWHYWEWTNVLHDCDVNYRLDILNRMHVKSVVG